MLFLLFVGFPLIACLHSIRIFVVSNDIEIIYLLRSCCCLFHLASIGSFCVVFISYTFTVLVFVVIIIWSYLVCVPYESYNANIVHYFIYVSQTVSRVGGDVKHCSLTDYLVNDLFKLLVYLFYW